MEQLAITGNRRRLRHQTGNGPGRRRSRKRYKGVGEQGVSLRDLYCRLVSTTLAVRRDRFAKWVLRVVAHVRQTKGWTLTRLLAESEIKKSVYYRWTNREWVSDLEPSGIERFADAAGVSVAEPLAILWPGRYGPREATPVLPPDPDFDLIMQKLNDPNTSKEDLYLIRATFEMLLDRIAADRRRRA